MLLNLPEKKIELARLILETDNPALLQKVEDVFATTTYTMTDDQLRAEIELGIRQLDNGEHVAWKDFRKKYFKSK